MPPPTLAQGRPVFCCTAHATSVHVYIADLFIHFVFFIIIIIIFMATVFVYVPSLSRTFQAQS